MKKAGILIFTLLLVTAMFSGCRRSPDTTNTTAAPTTSTTTKATRPTTGTTKPSSGVIPDATDMMPQPTNGTDAGRRHRGPRY